MTARARPRRSSAKKSESAPAASEELGPRLRLARERSGISVRELARRVGVSASHVSQMERHRVMPSVGTLYSIANELGLLIDDLLFPTGANGQARKSARRPAARAARKVVQRHDRRKAIKLAAGVHWEQLSPAPDEAVEFLYVVYEPGGASCEEGSLIRHTGREYAYILSGRLTVRVGADEYELGPGDSLTFDAQRPHRLWNAGDEPAIAIWVVANRGDDRRRVAA